MDLLVHSTSSCPGPANSISLKRRASGAQDELLAVKRPQALHDAPFTRARAKKGVETVSKENDKIIVRGPVVDERELPEPTGGHKPDASLVLPVAPPAISSDIRAALCDSLDYWRSHQGGIHSVNKVALGMLLNGKTTPRDVLQAQVIVTSIGGGLTTAADGKFIRDRDQQVNSKNCVALHNAMRVQQPIGVVIGKQKGDEGYFVNNLLRIKLDHHYNVLCFFFVTDIWPERQPTQRDGTSYIHYAVRLQRIDLETMSWWTPEGRGTTKDMHEVGQHYCRMITCQVCGTSSKETFRQGWCCLNKACQQFFRFLTPGVDVDTLQYHPDFLNERVHWNSDCPLPELIPDLPVLDRQSYGSEARFKRGIVCPNCSFASRRISWGGWRCEKGCGFELSMPPRDIPMTLIKSETDKVMGRRAKFFQVDNRIRRSTHNVIGYEVSSFYLPNALQNINEADFIGAVTIFRPTRLTLERDGGVNELFHEIQRATRQGDVELQRHPARCRGELINEPNLWYANKGADYKFGVVVETSHGFGTAPPPIMKALSRLTWGGSVANELTAAHVAEAELSVDSESMPNQFIDFNEQLLLGYFQGSTISFHDDGEKELGPTVATLSVGSPSTMRFRAKKKAGFEDTVGASGIMLSFTLEHGDMVIMHGTRIHQYYEHEVVAAGIRRYAFTCRYIRPEMMEDPDQRERAIKKGAVPLYWQRQAYQGESG
ncbi:hypothetical protein F4777DRAFT_592799 [Nemania sp. FL0916]|nr:hypothetical protein F4777DRAFT_592799 [Nemania sp. FL0916]